MIKKLIGLTIFVSIFFANSYAQQGNNLQNLPQKRAEFLTKRLAVELDLSEIEMNRFYLVNLRYEIISDSIRRLPISGEQKEKVFSSTVLLRRQDYQKVLSPAQYQKYLQLVEEKRIRKGSAANK